MESIEKTEKLDKVDLQILRTVQGNGRLTIKELAQQVNLSSTPVFERLKRMESRGYIQKYIAVLNAAKLNQGFVVFCNVKMMLFYMVAYHLWALDGLGYAILCSGLIDLVVSMYCSHRRYGFAFLRKSWVLFSILSATITLVIIIKTKEVNL